MTLDDLEHGTIREEFDEARIHFVLVCAARSCPRLRRTALTGKNLDSVLERAAEEFVPRATELEGEGDDRRIVTSALFDWFEEDFEEAAGSVQKYLKQYFDDPKVRAALDDEDVEIEFRDYDWSLNAQ